MISVHPRPFRALAPQIMADQRSLCNICKRSEVAGLGASAALYLTSVNAARRQMAHAGTAQRDLDLRPDLYTYHYRNEFPERFHPLMDTQRWGPGERLVFEPYTKEAHAQTSDWI